MDWTEFNKSAYELVEEKGKLLERQILLAYGELFRAIDNRIKDLYLNILEDVTPANFYNTLLKYNRLENLKRQLLEDIKKYRTGINTATINYIKMQLVNSYYYKQYAANWVIPDLAFGIIPDGIVELAVYSTAESFKRVSKNLKMTYGKPENYMASYGTISDILKRNWDDAILKIQQEITVGLSLGESYSKISTRLKNIIGQTYRQAGITKVNGLKAKAMRIIRTEGNRARNLGSFANSMRLKNMGHNIKKRYIAVLDDRTRPQSASMDGQTVDIDEPFEYPNGVKAMVPGSSGVAAYDIHDRCTYVEIIDNIEPTARMGRDPVTGKNETFTYKNFDKWAEEKGLVKNRYGQYYKSGG